MQLKTQYLEQVRLKTQSTGLSTTSKALLIVGAAGLLLVAIDASASVDKLDIYAAPITALTGESKKVFDGLVKIVPFAIGAAVAMAAMRGAMGYVMGLVASALRAG